MIRVEKEIGGVFAERLRDREQPGARPQHGHARPSGERDIKIGELDRRRGAVACRQS